MNGPAQETKLVEESEELVDEFRRHLRRLECHLTRLDQYREQRQILRSLDRNGVDGEWARRELIHRWKKGGEPEENDNSTAA